MLQKILIILKHAANRSCAGLNFIQKTIFNNNHDFRYHTNAKIKLKWEAINGNACNGRGMLWCFLAFLLFVSCTHNIFFLCSTQAADLAEIQRIIIVLQFAKR